MEIFAQLLGMFIGCLLVIIPFWKICGKTGRSPALSLLIFIPLLGWFILLIMLAFGDWPSLTNLQQKD